MRLSWSRIDMIETSSSQDLASNPFFTRIMFSAMWISHFLLWSFGDMLALLQENVEPITETVIMVIAPSLAIIQTLMIVYSLRGSSRKVRLLNMIVPFVFLLFNIQYLFESSQIWSYVLGAGYIGYNLMIIWTAWKWRAADL